MKLTRESVEALREQLVIGERGRWTFLQMIILCDHYLSTPTAEPTAGDARAVAEACIPMYGTISTKRAAMVEAVYQALLAQRPNRDELPNVSDLEERLLAFFDQPVHYDAMGFIRTLRAAIEDAAAARPSLGAAGDAVMAERERCAQIAEDFGKPGGQQTYSWNTEQSKRIAAAIRASSPEGSPDDSPDGEERVDTIIAEGHKRVRNIIDAYDPPAAPKAGADGEGDTA